MQHVLVVDDERDEAEAMAMLVSDAGYTVATARTLGDARRQIARREMLDHQWIGDHWWRAAVASGLFHVGNHSWDHLSPSVAQVQQREGKSGYRKYIPFALAQARRMLSDEFPALSRAIAA